MEPAYRLRKGGRDHAIRQRETLVELARRGHVQAGDEIWVTALGRAVPAGQLPELGGVFPEAPVPAPVAPSTDRPRPGPRLRPSLPPPDPWDLWEGESVPDVDDLVAEFGGGPALPPSEAPPPPTAAPAPPDAAGSAEIAGDVPPEPSPAPRPAPPGRRAPAGPSAAGPPPPPRPSPPAPGAVPGATSPRMEGASGVPSFTDWVARQGSGGATPLVLRPDGPPITTVEDGRRPLVGRWVWVLSALLAVGVIAVRGWIVAGATQEIPVEEDGPLAPLPESRVARTVPIPVGDTVGAAEQRLRARLPEEVRRFRDESTLRDVLYQDLWNTGVRVKAVRVQPSGSGRGAAGRRPMRVQIEVEIDGSSPETVPDQLALASLLVGLYAEKAAVNVDQLLLHTLDAGTGARVTYPVQGRGLGAFYARETDLGRFLDDLL